MLIERHHDIRIEKRSIGDEGAPLLVIDQLVADPERLVRRAARRAFGPMGEHFPGARTGAPAMYGPLLESVLNPFGSGRELRNDMRVPSGDQCSDDTE